ncbi:hypothetical protein IK110_03570 [Candidatus Saccharibacteria bacterium]|nr:hypothetical protein [Candidatus Saccharibacteria bacterium]
MNWQFSWGWFFIGIAVMAISLVIIKSHRWIGDNVVGGGVDGYNKVKLAGIIGCIVGIVFISNIHTLILYFIMHLVAPSRFP